MRDGGRISAAIEVVEHWLDRKGPVREDLRDWGSKSRFAGAKDRAFVSGLVLDVLRQRYFLAHAMQEGSGQALVFAALVHCWGWPLSRILEACTEEHGPSSPDGSVTDRLVALMSGEVPEAPFAVAANIPEWLEPYVLRAFGDEALAEMRAMSKRAPVDMRVNTLKARKEKVLQVLKSTGAVSIPELTGALSLPVPDSLERAETPSRLPAFSRGWFEIQDRGSQVAAAASGVRAGQQVMDYCAGGGGKTLAMSAWMDNRGQIYAHDVSSRRLSALIPRLHRSGGRNVQLFSPGTSLSMESLSGQMDIVLVDVPCSGTGRWRRRPDSKWRFGEKALSARVLVQDEILEASAPYVKPGGYLLYVTCSFLSEENEDRIEAFLNKQRNFEQMLLDPENFASGSLSREGEQRLRMAVRPDGSMRLTPLNFDSDVFFAALLRRRSG